MQAEPPFIPTVTWPGDTSNFRTYSKEENSDHKTPKKTNGATLDTYFKGFEVM
jgi:hypothetical protein